MFVPFGKDINKARKEAELLDEKLAQRQRAYRLHRELDGLHVLRPNGGIIGLQHNRMQRSDRKPFERFHCRVEQNGKITFKDFIINRSRTFDEAFQMAVEFIAEKRDVDKNSIIFKRMLAEKVFYEKAKSSYSNQKESCLNSEEKELFRHLSQEAANFELNRNRHVVKGHGL